MNEKGRPATGRPSEDAAAKPLFELDSTGTQLRRRRAASLRCEPMADGRRDPISREMAGRRTLHVEVGRRTAWLFGMDGRDVFTLLDRAGIERRQWDQARRVWMIPINRTDDLLAYAEHVDGRFTTVEAVDR